MPEAPQNPDLPFAINEWIIDTGNGQRAQYTGKTRKVGTHWMVEIRYGDGTVKRRPLGAIRTIDPETGTSIVDQLANQAFGKIRDIQRLITFHKLKGTLHEVVYSMEAAQIDFYPYQFKPVLKFIQSPTERLILADEVGLGKTIESALVWTELQARRQARRLLVVCPKILTEKWRDELRSKFLFDARIVDFRNLQLEIAELKEVGPIHPFVLIASYTGLRPTKAEIDLLDTPLGEDSDGSAKTRFLREIKHWNYSYSPFDLVIFDEAHYMRNPATSTFSLGESLTNHDSTAVLCVSATPINNSNRDLHSLLRLIDRDFFETQGMFEELLEVNRPTVRAINTLSKPQLDMKTLQEEVGGMARSAFIKDSPLFQQFLLQLNQLEKNPQNRALLALAQDSAEKLNLLGNYVNRTRRIQVESHRPVRDVHVLEVTYTKEEMNLYTAIQELVHRLCEQNQQPLHVFRVLVLQLQAASCLPAMAESIRRGRLGGLHASLDEMSELLEEGAGYDAEDHRQSDNSEEELSEEVSELPNLKELIDYDFSGNDSKFAALGQMLAGTAVKGEKVVIFAYYRKTLAYLRHRLLEKAFSVSVIHGGVGHDERWDELDRFKDPAGPNILLSSEVGSEGIDLQFCSLLVNYDLPWNPMKVEQRIGRIDRVGQKADQLRVFNFKVQNTIEERLYDRLHSKLIAFSNSLGDLEIIIGEAVQKLTIELLSKKLTPEQQEARMNATYSALENQLVQVKNLEESGDSLVALSDYVQNKIKDDHEKGRFLQAEELQDYIADFFERHFPGTELNYNTPADGCLMLRLSYDAQSSLADYIRNDHSLNARTLRQRDFAISFKREAMARLPSNLRKRVTFINHLSPLIRWITEINQQSDHDFNKTSALEVSAKEFSAGTYLFRIERWMFTGLSSKNSLHYGVYSLDAKELMPDEQCEQFMQVALREGKNWNYAEWDSDDLLEGYKRIAEHQEEKMSDSFTRFEAENNTTIQIRKRRASNHWDRLIQQSEQAIQTMIRVGRRESLIKGRKTRLENELINKKERLAELEKGGATDFDTEEIAAGIIRNKQPMEL